MHPTQTESIPAATTAWPAGVLLMLFVAFAAVCAHAYGLADIPRGFYIDESSIGYNAWLIATTGRDEHDVAWPLYFRAFGEYKNPIHIYVLAAIYRAFGLSETATRAASCLAWLLGSLTLLDLCRRLATTGPVRLYALICIGFTPWLFALSRVSFELIWLYPLLAVHLWAVHAACERGHVRWAVVAGVALGLSAYAYSTFRLLAPLQLLALLMAYPGRAHWRAHARTGAGFAVSVLPLVFYLAAHSDALTARFEVLTYLHEPGWTFADKAGAFVSRYVGYFSPDFLVLRGDTNLRHHTGVGGELLLATSVLGIVGCLLALRRSAHAFVRLLVFGVLLAPVAAALTRDQGHSLRAFSMLVFVLPLSVIGAVVVRQRMGAAIMGAIVTAAGLQAGVYIADYFHAYPQRSVLAFESYGFKQALQVAQWRATGRVLVDSGQNQPYMLVLFERALQQESTRLEPQPPIALGSRTELRPGDLFVAYDPLFKCVDCRDGLLKDGLYGIIDFEHVKESR
jgi:hypothetical protein